MAVEISLLVRIEVLIFVDPRGVLDRRLVVLQPDVLTVELRALQRRERLR